MHARAAGSHVATVFDGAAFFWQGNMSWEFPGYVGGEGCNGCIALLCVLAQSHLHEPAAGLSPLLLAGCQKSASSKVLCITACAACFLDLLLMGPCSSCHLANALAASPQGPVGITPHRPGCVLCDFRVQASQGAPGCRLQFAHAVSVFFCRLAC